jgi:circadian clock protein KaiC
VADAEAEPPADSPAAPLQFVKCNESSCAPYFSREKLSAPSLDHMLSKTPTGINGFDEITSGGLPTGRPSLICGAAGCGKTVFGMTFLLEGALRYGEPGVLMSFEEPLADLVANVHTLGYNVDDLIERKLLYIDHVDIDPSNLEQSGDYDLEGLFVRLDYAISSIGAKRVVLDTLEILFASFDDAALLRNELRRLFKWLKDKGVTAVITGERGEGQLTRHGIEEYVSDCVIVLDNRVENQITTRRMRVVKYRGSAHGTNEYPFLIDEQGFSVLPVTSVGLEHKTSQEIVSSGIGDLDAMLGTGGYFVGSSVLVSGLAGTGKTTIAAKFIEACCSRGERAMYFSFEESRAQILRNMASVGMDFARFGDDLLRIESARPSFYGLETHLARMHREIDKFDPTAVVVDPISALRGSESEIHTTLLRLVDLLKSRGITAVFTSLSGGDEKSSINDRSISSLMDTWISVSHTEANGERNRLVHLFKSRGMPHSNQVREFHIGMGAIKLVPAYVGSEGVLTGSARLAQEAHERQRRIERQAAIEQKKREAVRRRELITRQIADLQAEIAASNTEIQQIDSREDELAKSFESDRIQMALKRGSVL